MLPQTKHGTADLPHEYVPGRLGEEESLGRKHLLSCFIFTSLFMSTVQEPKENTLGGGTPAKHG